MLRIGLFLLTNIAVMAIVSIILMLLGINPQSGQYGGLLVMCILYGMIGSFFSLFISKWAAKRSTGTQIIEKPSNPTEQWLFDTVSLYAKRSGIGMPEVGVFPSDAPNAFATGWNKNKALVAVSTGLLQKMNKQEVEAVIGHEIGHVANGDMVTLALIQGVVNAFVMFLARVLGDIIDRVVLKNEERGFAYFGIVMALQIGLGFLASAIVMWFSRRREYRADEAGARLGGKQNMINALLALQGGHANEEPMPENMRAMGIKASQAKSWFSTHPSIEDRVAALQAKQIV